MSYFEIINLNESNKWDKIVTSFKEHDVYFLNAYVKAFYLHGDGEPLLLYYKNNDLKGINVVMKRDISLVSSFNGIIPNKSYFDLITPYGYGGFLFEGNACSKNINVLINEYKKLLIKENIVSEFVRYHPQLNNASFLRSDFTVIDLGKTISMDLTSLEIIWSNITSKNRNMIRKAQKSGIEILHGKGLELLDKFKSIYNSTMDNDNALPYYYFKDNFYESLHRDLLNNYEIFYAVLKENIIAMSIIIYTNERMHYHLSGSLVEYRSLAPSNLLLYEAACWGYNQGIKTFHLGGGLGSEEDNLFKFKQAFNRNSSNQFSIGKLIINQEMYDSLVEIRKNYDRNFNSNSSYFPLYRS